MAASSAIPGAKAALKTRLAARANLKTVQISYGPPIPNPGREFIWLADAPDSQHDVFLGQMKREEEFTLQAIVSVLREGVDQQSATERAYALVDEIHADLNTDPTINGALANGWARITATPLTELANDTAREARVVVEITCHARIT